MTIKIRSILLKRLNNIEWDDKKRCFHDRPYHDWTADFMDALRYLALSVRRETMKREPLPTHAEHEYNIIGL